MARYCFLSRVRPDRIEEYRRSHTAVWPEMLKALCDTGWTNYSLFLREDGLLVGYMESEDLDRSRRLMEQTDVNARWQAQMAPYFADLDGGRPDESFVVLEQVFNLEDQLSQVENQT